MALRTPEPVQVVKQRRDDALAAIVAAIPYIQFLNVSFERRGDELTAVMAYRDTLIGNPRCLHCTEARLPPFLRWQR